MICSAATKGINGWAGGRSIAVSAVWDAIWALVILSSNLFLNNHVRNSHELFTNIAEATLVEKKEAELAEEDSEEDVAEEDESLAPNAFEVQPGRPKGCNANALQEGPDQLCANAPRIPRKLNVT